MISQLKDRVLVLEPASTPDGGGGRATTWTIASTLSAQVTYRRSRRLVAAARSHTLARTRTLIRALADLTPSHRLDIAGRAHAILSITPLSDEPAYLVLETEEVQS